MNAIGIRLSDASARTGYSQKQLRYLASQGRIRWQKRGRFVLLHAQDVAALAEAAWNGKPVEVAQ